MSVLLYRFREKKSSELRVLCAQYELRESIVNYRSYKIDGFRRFTIKDPSAQRPKGQCLDKGEGVYHLIVDEDVDMVVMGSIGGLSHLVPWGALKTLVTLLLNAVVQGDCILGLLIFTTPDGGGEIHV